VNPISTAPAVSRATGSVTPRDSSDVVRERFSSTKAMNFGAIRVLAEYGTPAQKERFLKRLLAGEGVISVGIGVLVLMLVFVIPKFEDMLKESGQELPGPTQFVIDASHFFADHFPIILGGTLSVVFIIYRFLKTQQGRAMRDRALFGMPLFGTLTQKAGTAKFARTMATLLSSGVNLIDGIDICRATIGNVVLEDATGKIRAEVESGKTLGGVIGRLGVFPRMACQMISVGEGTGSLDKMLEKVADFYEEEVETLVTGMTKLIEPAIIVILGGMIGGMMIAMYLPLFKLASGSGG
jgi:type IV pilus assembly protein PilC